MFVLNRHLLRGVRITLLMAVLVLVTFGSGPVPDAYAATTLRASLVQTIDTSQWNPPSPDPSGITYWPAHGTLMVSDGEVDEMAIFQGYNVFEATRMGNLVQTHSTMSFSSEPVGIEVAVNPGNGHFFISDDDQQKVFEIDLGGDERLGTEDDIIVTSFSTSAYGNNDPEGIAYGLGKLFLSDGAGKEVYTVDPGANGIFDGVSPAGDDQVTQFDVAILGMDDPEGIGFNTDSNTLYVIDKAKKLIEITTDGTLVSTIDIWGLNAVAPSDVTRAPASDNSGAMHLYISDRGVDNNEDPNENDGKVYEVTLEPPTGNLLENSGFEIDRNNDGIPDKWGNNSKFTRSAEVVYGETYAGKHAATDDLNYTIYQKVPSLSAGTTYTFSGWVNIPPTIDAFTLWLQVQWRDASNTIISTQTIKKYTDVTIGWEQATGSLVAPSGTDHAHLRMAVSSLNATIYVDDFMFQAQ